MGASPLSMKPWYTLTYSCYISSVASLAFPFTCMSFVHSLHCSYSLKSMSQFSDFFVHQLEFVCCFCSIWAQQSKHILYKKCMDNVHALCTHMLYFL